MSKTDGVVTNDDQVTVGGITDTKNTFVWYILETFFNFTWCQRLVGKVISCSYCVGAVNLEEKISSLTAFIGQKASVAISSNLHFNLFVSNKKTTTAVQTQLHLHRLKRKWFISACIFLSACPSRLLTLEKLAQAVQTQTCRMSSISVLIYSNSLRAHLYAWFKHSYRDFSAPTVHEKTISLKDGCRKCLCRH